MISSIQTLPLFWQAIGLLTGILLTLALFSFVLNETILFRATQYLLVGVAVGYAAVLVWHSVLLPRLIEPLFSRPPEAFLLQEMPGSPRFWFQLMPLLLGALFWLGLLKREGQPGRWLRALALLPAGIVAGVTVGVGIAGAIQGTLVPQFFAAADVQRGESFWLSGLITLLVSSGVVLHLHSYRLLEQDTENRSIAAATAAWLLRPLAWIGQRALWLAAGVIFARLFAARTLLLIDRLLYLLFDLRDTAVWSWLQALIQGGG